MAKDRRVTTVTIEFEVSDIPHNIYEKFEVQGVGTVDLLLHELLCKAIHEDDEAASEALEVLNDYVVNINIKEP